MEIVLAGTLKIQERGNTAGKSLQEINCSILNSLDNFVSINQTTRIHGKHVLSPMRHR